jgi:hypothetical protein
LPQRLQRARSAPMHRDEALTLWVSPWPMMPGITVTKLDAAKRQLRTAIRLWFEDGDPVSIHALAYAAYEIAHVVSKRRSHTRHDLIFDSLKIKEENRAEFNTGIKKHANFFKHAKLDWDDSIELKPLFSVLFIMGAGAGLRLAGEPASTEESAFALWLFLHRPQWVGPGVCKVFEKQIPIEKLVRMKAIPKSRFLKSVKIVPK